MNPEAGSIRGRGPVWLLIMAGLLGVVAAAVPAPAWIEFLRGGEAVASSIHLQGAMSFRVVLGILALYALWMWAFGWFAGEPTASRRPARSEIVLVACLLAVSLALRLLALGEGLWHDELITLTQYANVPFGEILTTYDSQNQHLMYSLLAHVVMEAFGYSEWTLRLPAALFGVGGVWALYVLGREVSDRTDALWAAGLIALSPQHVWFSQNARGYSAVFFFALLSTWLFLRAQRGGVSRLWIWYAVFTALGVLAHQTMLFVVAAQFVVYALGLENPRRETSRWLPLTSGFVLAGLLTLLAHGFVLPQLLSTAAEEVSPVATWRSPLWMLRETLRGFGLTPERGILLGLVGLAGLGVGVAGLRDYARRRPAVVVLAVLPPVAGALLVIGLSHHLWPRFFFFALGFAVLIMVRGVRVLSAWVMTRLAVRWGGKALLEHAILGLAILLSVVVLPGTYGPKQDFAAARDYVREAAEDADSIVSVGLAGVVYSRWYAPEWRIVADREELEAVMSSAPTTWLVYTLPFHMEAYHPDIVQSLAVDFDSVASFPGTLGDGAVHVYRSR